MTSWMRWSAVAVALTASGWASAQQQGVTADEIRVGTIQDLSGPIAALGKQVRNGMQMRVDEINKADAEDLVEIIWDLKVAEFINLANGSAREDVAGAVKAPDNKPYKSTAEFKAAVVEVVATYLELIEAVETAGDKVDLAEALTAAFEFIDKIDKGDPVAGTMVDNVWEYMAGEDFKGFKSITGIWSVAQGV